MTLKKFTSTLVVIFTVLALAACGTSGNGNGTGNGTGNGGSNPPATEGNYKDGTYKGTGKGYNGPIEVEVVVTDGKVSDLKILSHQETEGVGDKAFDPLKEQLIEKQSDQLDTVSGATGTSNGVIEAVKAALSDAKK